MSIIYCELHGLNWDSDKRSECPACENEHAEDEEVEPAIVVRSEYSWEDGTSIETEVYHRKT